MLEFKHLMWQFYRMYLRDEPTGSNAPPPTLSTSRLEAFSDGVIAVAITLLVLDLHVPSPTERGSLARHLFEQWPSFAAYLVSFLTIGVIWLNHHAMLRRFARADHSVLTLNVLLLMCIVVLPFSTSLMAAYLTAPAGHLAAVIYGGSLSVLGTPVKVGSVGCLGCLSSFRSVLARGGPQSGVKVERPQRSEDERP